MIVTNVYPFAKLWKVIVKHCIESLRQALEFIRSGPLAHFSYSLLLSLLTIRLTIIRLTIIPHPIIVYN